MLLSTIAPTMLPGIRFLMVVATGVISFAVAVPSSTREAPCPTPRIIPTATPMTAAMATMPMVTAMVLFTRSPMVFPCCMLMITCMMETITRGTTIILIRLMKPLPTMSNQVVVSLTKVTSRGASGKPATTWMARPSTRPMPVPIITTAAKSMCFLWYST